MFHRIALFFLLLIIPQITLAQGGGSNKPIPNVYLDCGSCDFTYIRTNVTFVNYVRDQGDATIYLMINDLQTAGGGREYTLTFSGIGDTDNTRSDTLRYVSPSTDSGDERRRGLTRYIKIGLIPFVSKTVAMETLNVFYEEPEGNDLYVEETVEDPWNNWVFDVNARTWMSGEKTEKEFSFFGGLFAERITSVWKIRMRVRGETERNWIELSEGTTISNRSWGEYWGLYAYSLTDHLSAGLFTKTDFSTYNNIAFNIEASPAIEYNIFPYTEYSERRFLVSYRLTPSFRNYFDVTIFDKTEELVLHQVLSVEVRYDRRWGRFTSNLSGSHFFHDTALNRLNFNTSLDVRIVRGLSVSFSGRYSLINDQIALKKGDFSDEEILLGLQQQATSYSYGLSFGLSYTFGSIYNNIVNPRF
ncbi:hypothetical protein [Rhodohalobacter sp. 614A]|uniref:hypothetical protein n=1 Tax=Rhodohalobacter sp. 614A TaxID=2908649 RepID=UPI001F3F6A69|nr:hypothetical protein [Rhodohalobacter sp. 614A]